MESQESAVASIWTHTIHRLLSPPWHDSVCTSSPCLMVAEIDDPLFAFLTTSTRGVVRPASRELGGFEPPEEDAEEPGRTERALDRFFSLWPVDARRMRAGDSLAELPTWLDDSSGTARGIWYLFCTIAIQLVTAAILGVTFAMEWPQSSSGGKVLLGILLFLQLATAWWSVSRTANDKIDGFEKGLVSIMEATSTCLLLAGAFLSDSAEGEALDMDRLTRSLELSAAGAKVHMGVVLTFTLHPLPHPRLHPHPHLHPRPHPQVLMGAVFLPMAITVCVQPRLDPGTSAVWDLVSHLPHYSANPEVVGIEARHPRQQLSRTHRRLDVGRRWKHARGWLPDAHDVHLTPV